MVQVVSLDKEGPQGDIQRNRGGGSKPFGLPILDGDGYLAPGRMATRALNRKQTKTNRGVHKCSSDREKIQGPDTEQI